MNNKGQSSHSGNPDTDNSLSAQAFEYYQQHSQNRKLPKYFCGAYDLGNPDNAHHTQLHGETTTKVDFRPPLIGEDNVTQIPIIHLDSDTTNELVRPPSPTSSVASNRKLEWDNGADIGYDNCQANKSLYKSHSLPILSSLDLQKNYLRLSPEGINTDPNANTKSTTSGSNNVVTNKLVFVTSSSDNSGSIHNPVYTSSSSSGLVQNPELVSTSSSSQVVDEKQSTDESSINEIIPSNAVLNYLKLKVGVPIANSTPHNQFEPHNSITAIYNPTPVTSRPEKPKRVHQSSPTLSKLVKGNSLSKDLGSTPKIEGTLKQNVFYYSIPCKDSTSSSSSNKTPTIPITNKKYSSCENLSTIINDGGVRKWSSQLDLSLEQRMKYLSGHRNRQFRKLGISKPISVECIGVKKSRDKDIQTSFLDNVSVGIQTDCNEPNVTSVAKQGIVYSQHLYSDEECSNATANVASDAEQISNCNSFEFLCGSDFDLKLGKMKEGSRSKENSPKILLNEYLSNNLKRSEGKSDLTDGSTPLLKSEDVQNLSPDVGRNLKLLQKLLKSKKYDEATKKYYIKKIVQKIKNFEFDDSSFDSNKIVPEILKSSENLLHDKVLSDLQNNVPWIPAFQKTTMPSSSNLDNKQNDRQTRNKKITKNIIPQHTSNSTSTESANNYPKTFVLPQNPIINYSDTTNEKTSNESKSWRDDKTLSEQRLERKKIGFSSGDSPEMDHIIKFAQNERETQLLWINNEIEHLNKLKKILELKDTVNHCIDSKITKKTTLYMITTEKNRPNEDNALRTSVSHDSHLLPKMGARRKLRKNVPSPSKIRRNIKRSQSSDHLRQKINEAYLQKKSNFKQYFPTSTETSEDPIKHEKLNLSDFDNIEKFVSSNDDETGLPNSVQIYRFSENHKMKKNKYSQFKDNWNEQYMKSKSRNVKYSQRTGTCISCNKGSENGCACKGDQLGNSNEDIKNARYGSQIDIHGNPQKSMLVTGNINGNRLSHTAKKGEEPLIHLHKRAYNVENSINNQPAYSSEINNGNLNNAQRAISTEDECIYPNKDYNLDAARTEVDYNSHDHKKSVDSDKPKFSISESDNRTCPLLISCIKNQGVKKNNKIYDDDQACPCLNTFGNQTKNALRKDCHADRIVVEIHNKRKTPPLINIIEEVSSEDLNNYIGNNNVNSNSAKASRSCCKCKIYAGNSNSGQLRQNETVRDTNDNMEDKCNVSNQYSIQSARPPISKRTEDEGSNKMNDATSASTVKTQTSKMQTSENHESNSSLSDVLRQTDTGKRTDTFSYESPCNKIDDMEGNSKSTQRTMQSNRSQTSRRNEDETSIRSNKPYGSSLKHSPAPSSVRSQTSKKQYIDLKSEGRGPPKFLDEMRPDFNWPEPDEAGKISRALVPPEDKNGSVGESQNRIRSQKNRDYSRTGEDKLHSASMKTQTSKYPVTYPDSASYHSSRSHVSNEQTSPTSQPENSRNINAQSSKDIGVNQPPRQNRTGDGETYGKTAEKYKTSNRSSLTSEVSSTKRSTAPFNYESGSIKSDKSRNIKTQSDNIYAENRTAEVRLVTAASQAGTVLFDNHPAEYESLSSSARNALEEDRVESMPVIRIERSVVHASKPGTYRDSKDSESRETQAISSAYDVSSAKPNCYQKSTTSNTPKIAPSSTSTATTAATATVTSSSSSSSSSDSTEAHMLCACCQKRYACSRLNFDSNTYCRLQPPGFCDPCYRQSQTFEWDQQNPYYRHPQHVCNCNQSPKIRDTMTEIKHTVQQLADLEACETLCTCHGKSSRKSRCPGCGSKIKKPKPVAYMLTFEPGQPEADENLNKPNRSLEEVRVKIPAKCEKKENKHKHQHKHTKPEKSKNKKHKYTLQECLAMNKPSFIENAEQRRQCLIELSYMREQRCQKYKQLLALTNGIPMQNPSYIDQFNKKRLFSSKEMKRMTAKKYKTLPEVRQKVVDSREQQIKKANRLLADIFNKKLRENVLRGHASLSASVSVINSF